MYQFILYALFVIFFIIYCKTDEKHLLYLSLFFFITLIRKILFDNDSDSVFANFLILLQFQFIIISIYTFYKKCKINKLN